MPLLPYSGWLITFISVVLAWVIFRADSVGSASTVFASLAGLNGVVWPDFIPSIPGLHFAREHLQLLGKGQILLILLAGLVSFGLPNVHQAMAEYSPALAGRDDWSGRFRRAFRWSVSYRWVLGVAFIGMATLTQMFFRTEQVEFLYFQF